LLKIEDGEKKPPRAARCDGFTARKIAYSSKSFVIARLDRAIQ
jgi:hypothetical protein